MDLEIIKTVLAVAQLKSFSAAAFAIPCSQSSVSRRVEAAESELGVTIFVRPAAGGARSVELTETGQAVVGAMDKVVEAYAELFSIAGERGRQVALNIGMRTNIMPPMGVSLMKADFFEENLNTVISVTQDDLNVLLSGLWMKRFDAVLFRCTSLDETQLHVPKGFSLLHLGKARLQVGVSSKNPLSERSVLRKADLRGATFFLAGSPNDSLPGIEFSTNRRFLDAFGEGEAPNIKQLPNNVLEIRYKLTMEDRGMFVSYTPAPWRIVENITYLSVEDLPLKSNFYMIYAPGGKEKEILDFGRFFSRRLEPPD